MLNPEPSPNRDPFAPDTHADAAWPHAAGPQIWPVGPAALQAPDHPADDVADGERFPRSGWPPRAAGSDVEEDDDDDLFIDDDEEDDDLFDDDDDDSGFDDVDYDEEDAEDDDDLDDYFAPDDD